MMVYVQVCDRNGNPIDFSRLNMGINATDGVFMSINEAITAVGTLNPKLVYTLYLKDEGPINADHILMFDEFVQIPESMTNIEFISRNAIIRAIQFKPWSFAIFGNNVHVNTIIDGDIYNQVNNYKIFYQKPTLQRSSELQKLHKNQNSSVLAAKLIQDYIQNVQQTKSLFDLLERIKGLTSNFQVILSTFYLADYFNVIQLKIHELDSIISSKDLTPYFKKLDKEVYVQELLETMAPVKRKIQQTNMKTLQFLTDLDSCEYVSTERGYRGFLYKFLEIIGENIWVQRQILRKLVEIDVVGESLHMVHLQQVDALLLETQVLLNQLSNYVHRVGDPSFLVEGENSSELLLNLATQALQGPHAGIFREALISFLNEKSSAKISEGSVVKNSELLAYLREYTSNCPDADYYVIRLMKNYSESITGITTGLGGISSLGTIATTSLTLLKNMV